MMDHANKEAGRRALGLAKAVENFRPKGAALCLADCHGQDPEEACADETCDYQEICEALRQFRNIQCDC